MDLSSLPSVSAMYQPTTFNYERPKHFIQSKPKCQVESTSQSTNEAVHTSRSPKKISISILPQPCSSYNMSSAAPVAPSKCSKTEVHLQPQSSNIALSGQENDQSKNTSTAFLAISPSKSQSKPKMINTGTSNLPNASVKTDLRQDQHEYERGIQGTKDALIQDLERKLKCKDSILHNGNQRLTYEEKMARRLLGAENAASVFEDHMADSVQDSKQIRDSVTMPSLQQHEKHSRNRESTSGSIQEKYFPPRFLQVPEDLTVEEGHFCRIDFKVAGVPVPDVSWYLNGKAVQADDFHKFIVSEKGVHSFIFEVVKTYDAGLYKCVASNRAGKSTFTLQLDVLAQERKRPPCFIQKPAAIKAIEGENIKIECLISAIPQPQILLKKNNEMLRYNTDRIRLYQDDSGRVSLVIYNVNKTDDGWYTISAVNEAGVATCHARLDVATIVNKQMPSVKQLKVKPTFSRYSALNMKGLDVQEAYSLEKDQNSQPTYPGLLESEEL
nr:titin immunoglobulin domain protein (myotilin) [Xenopus tropicalis]